MKVFVVSKWWAYEGHSEPLAVFSTEDAAEQYVAARADPSTTSDGYDITELVLDHAAD